MKLAVEFPSVMYREGPEGISRLAKNGLALFEGLGWKQIRSCYRMVTDLEAAPEIPELPAGITIRAYDPETELNNQWVTRDVDTNQHLNCVTWKRSSGFHGESTAPIPYVF